ncbi:MAG: hypothetical protein KF768_04165 [Phycisphaeraceae bacterium]|nr:hypothetical protein [Phycisphaeraceae bacterium]
MLTLEVPRVVAWVARGFSAASAVEPRAFMGNPAMNHPKSAAPFARAGLGISAKADSPRPACDYGR